MIVADEPLDDAELGPLLARGRDAEVFALGPDRVVRRSSAGTDPAREVAVMEHVRAAGYPAPEVHRIAPGEMVIDRVHGPTMLDDIAQHPWRVRRHGRLLADLHRRLHAVTAPRDLPPHPWEGDAVLHLDLHPANVILSPHGPVVIDWTNARRGGGGADLADVWIVVACLGAEPDPDPSPMRRLVTRVEPLVRRRLLAAFLDAAGRADARAALAATAGLRLADRNIAPHERTRIEALLAAEGVSA